MAKKTKTEKVNLEDTIQDIKDSLWENLSSKEQDIWNYFKALKVNAFNEMLNPFCPKKTKYKKGKAETSKESIIEFIEKCDNKNIIVWAKEQLLINEVEKAFNLLLKINGIGGKIASFFLRDVAVKYNINVSVGRHLLQPIDVWVRYYVNNIMGNNFDDKKIQEYICDQCKKQDGLNPEKINQGIWYLCVEIAHSSKYLLKKCYDDKNQFLRLIKENRDMHAIANKVASKWIDRTSDGH